MNYPLQISFKAIALSNQGTVTDASGNVVAYVKQKAFKLKEAITVFTDQSQTTPMKVATSASVPATLRLARRTPRKATVSRRPIAVAAMPSMATSA